MDQNIDTDIAVNISNKDILYFISICILLVIVVGLFLIVPSPFDKSKKECESTMCNKF